MTKIKLCGLTRPSDVEVANRLKPEYVGFVFAKKSRRYVEPQTAGALKKLLSPEIQAVGVFVKEDVEEVAALLNSGVIDMAQLHGNEEEAYIRRLRQLTRRPIIKAFQVGDSRDLAAAAVSSADHVLLDSGAGTGTVFDWALLKSFTRPYFLAGGLSPDNVGKAVAALHPFAVDVSSGIEVEGRKDPTKMAAFVAAVRKEEQL